MGYWRLHGKKFETGFLVILNQEKRTKNKMMTTKEKNRISKYKNSNGIARAWYYLVIALTMGNVDSAVEEYDREQARSREREIDNFTSRERLQERCAPSYGRGGVVSHTKPVLRVDEREETEDIDLITAAILAQHVAENQSTGQYDVEPQADGWGGFGGGGDFGGGGAGGEWSPTSSVESNTTPSMLTDSY
jgi:uncharacterized membrane protein YgcG